MLTLEKRRARESPASRQRSQYLRIIDIHTIVKEVCHYGDMDHVTHIPVPVLAESQCPIRLVSWACARCGAALAHCGSMPPAVAASRSDHGAAHSSMVVRMAS